ncbi:uncharacterized protein LOC107366004 [Tetranychus urticae]|uniref:Major facilitator superfamily (MFS) profile domain-containing protein n=1 Tax=Tetranychus urticae TaxID=32264 RepID=T1KNN9_TETUR|nr:uncharacterized protein LOC107366004 [Tetranychus urticae]
MMNDQGRVRSYTIEKSIESSSTNIPTLKVTNPPGPFNINTIANGSRSRASVDSRRYSQYTTWSIGNQNNSGRVSITRRKSAVNPGTTSIWCKLRIDVMIFFLIFASAVQNITVTRIENDKICFNQFHSRSEFCFPMTLDGQDTVNLTLQTVKRIYNIKPIELSLSIIPATLTTALFSIWIDAYPKYLKYMVSIPTLGFICQVVILLVNTSFFELNSVASILSYIPFGLLGGTISPMTAVYIFISRTTQFKDRLLRFAILHTFVITGSISGTMVGGWILRSRPWTTAQPENYIGLLAFVLIIGLIWLTFFLPISPFVTPIETSGTDNISEYSYKTTVSNYYISQNIFKLSNLRVMWYTFTRPRLENGRLRLWLLIAGLLIILCCTSGRARIHFDFSARVYQWDPMLITFINLLIILVPTLFTLVTAPILTKTLDYEDTTVGIIGSISLLLMNIVRGFFLQPQGFIASYLCGCLSGLVTISIRSIISKIIEEYEIGQIFSILSTLEHIFPILFSIFSEIILNYTFSINPGFIFWFFSTLLVFPVLLMIWLRATKSNWNYSETQQFILS